MCTQTLYYEDIMDGKKSQCMAVIFLLINKLKSSNIDTGIDLPDLLTTSPRLNNSSDNNEPLPSTPEKPPLKRPHSYTTSSKIEKPKNLESFKQLSSSSTSTITVSQSNNNDNSTSDKEDNTESKPVEKKVPPARPPRPVIRSYIDHRSFSAPPKPNVEIDITSTETIKTATKIQSYFRSYFVKQSYKKIKESLKELNTRILDDPKALKGLVKLQALIRSKHVWDTLKTKRRRNEIAKEILTTEESYVRSLTVLLSVYKEAFKQLGEELVPTSKIKSIFSEIEVIKGYNDLMYKKIKARMESWYSEGQRLGDIFLQFTDFLKVYTAYVNNYNATMSLIHELMQQPAVSQKLMECRNLPETNGLEIQSFMIMPIQRIPRYVLLLTDLFKCTKEDHQDYENLSKALKKMEDVAKYVNQKKREAENLLGVSTIVKRLTNMENASEFNQPHRRYVRHGILQEQVEGILSQKTLKSRYYFLFNDAIICAKEQSSGLVGRRKTITPLLDLDSIRESDVLFKFIYVEYLYGASIKEVEVEGSKPSTSFQISCSSGSSIILTLSDEQSRDGWVQDIDEAIMSCLEKKRSRLEIPSNEEKNYEVNKELHPSGHQLGYLYKLSEKGNWKKLYYVLVHDILYYYKTREDMDAKKDPRGTIYLLTASVHFQSVMDRPYCFKLYTKTKIYYFSAESWKDRMDWINSIRANVQKHLDEVEIKIKMTIVSQNIEPVKPKNIEMNGVDNVKKEQPSKRDSLNEPVKSSESNSSKRSSSSITEEGSQDEKQESSSPSGKRKGIKTRKSLRKKSLSTKSKSFLAKQIRAGELYKLSSNSKNKMTKYTFSLRPDWLLYFKSGKTKPYGSINLLLVQSVSDNIEKVQIKSKTKYKFTVTSSDRQYMFASDDEETARNWVDDINNAIKKLHNTSN